MLSESILPQKIIRFFFGSRIRGDNMERSDIDVGIERPKEISGTIMSAIKEEFEKIQTLLKIDLVDFKKISDKFKKISIKNREYTE